MSHCLTLTTQANRLREAGQVNAAIRLHVQAVRACPDVDIIYLNLGACLENKGWYGWAVTAYQRCLRLNPNRAEAAFNLALLYFKLGDYAQGFRYYPQRWQCAGYTQPWTETRIPRWQGEALAHQRLLVLAEGGFGDVVHGVRFAIALKQRYPNSHLTLQVQKPLLRLMSHSALADGVVSDYLAEDYDLVTSLWDVPSLLGWQDDLFEPSRYLRVTDAQQQSWQQQLSRIQGPRVGFVWRGNPNMFEDQWRSFTIADLAPIAKLGINLISLQKDATREEIAQLAQLGIAHHVGGLLQDFADTAACLQQLDMLITPDTAIAHVAGALGVPVCLALYQLGDWRWGTSAVNSPWYPSITIVRQHTLGQWQGVMQQIAQHLQAYLAIDDTLLAKRYFTIAYAYTQQKAWQRAVPFYQRAIAASAHWDEPHHHLAVCYQQLRHYTQAQAHYMAALALAPADNVMLRYHAAKCLKDCHQLDAALPLYQQAIQINPQLHDAYYSLGLCYFLKGDWHKAWPLYEYRFMGSDRAGTDQSTPLNLPKLNPAQLSANTGLIITAEQGMGDAIMCLRYLPYLKQHITKILWITHYPLVSLFKQYEDAQVSFIPWTTDPIDTTDYTHQFPLLSLPGAFNTTPNNLPNAPYIHADTLKRQQWQDTLNQLSPNKKRIGLVWQGGKVSVANGRDIPYHSLAPLLNDGQLNQHIDWYSLQKDTAPPDNRNIINLMPQVKDFTDTAAFIANLDLIITVDTAVAHLAGAMGKPVWLLNRYESEWRWMLGKEITHWYPSMRLFNQQVVDDWQPLVITLYQQLKVIC